MTGPKMNAPLDPKTKAKMVSLYRDHSISVRTLTERFGRSHATIKAVLEAAGVLNDGQRVGGP